MIVHDQSSEESQQFISRLQNEVIFISHIIKWMPFECNSVVVYVSMLDLWTCMYLSMPDFVMPSAPVCGEV